MELDEHSEKYSIEDILGNQPENSFESKKKQSDEKNTDKQANLSSSQFKITNNEEKISNSNSPLINESLQKEAELKENKDLIEINIEMTDEMKRLEQKINFGVTPYSAKSNQQSQRGSVSNANGSMSIVGHGIDSTQNQ